MLGIRGRPLRITPVRSGIKMRLLRAAFSFDILLPKPEYPLHLSLANIVKDPHLPPVKLARPEPATNCFLALPQEFGRFAHGQMLLSIQ
jgi:hypothetical protein